MSSLLDYENLVNNSMVNNNLGKYFERDYTEYRIRKVQCNSIVQHGKCQSRHYFKVQTFYKINFLLSKQSHSVL